jgi:hypothetical protein
MNWKLNTYFAWPPGYFTFQKYYNTDVRPFILKKNNPSKKPTSSR